MDQQQGSNGFADSLRDIGKKARDSMLEGAVTPGYTLDRGVAVKVLNDAIATEIVCWLRYLGHAYTARGIHSSVAITVLRTIVRRVTGWQYSPTTKHRYT